MKPAAFDYIRAETVDEILPPCTSTAARHASSPVASRWSPMLNMRLAKPAVLVDVMRVKALADHQR